MTTPQEEFWKGDFGDQYLQRNRVDWQARIPFWRSIIEKTRPASILEVGANAGWNLRAIREVDPSINLYGIDINPSAVAEARSHGLDVEELSASPISNWYNPINFYLTFTCGMLIHVAPDKIGVTMESIAKRSKRHILAVEYASDKEEEINYRGHTERLWKRPFGKLYEDLGLKIIAEGSAEGFDRCTFWLMEKP